MWNFLSYFVSSSSLYKPTQHISLINISHFLSWQRTILRMLDIVVFPPRSSKAPSGSGSPRCWGFTVTLRHTTVSRTPLDEWSAWRNNAQRSQSTGIHVSGGIRTHNPSTQAAADPRLRQRGQWGRLICVERQNKFLFEVNTRCQESALFVYLRRFPSGWAKASSQLQSGQSASSVCASSTLETLECPRSCIEGDAVNLPWKYNQGVSAVSDILGDSCK
jgi:hypothetical protein